MVQFLMLRQKEPGVARGFNTAITSFWQLCSGKNVTNINNGGKLLTEGF